MGHSNLSPDPGFDTFYAFGNVNAIGPGEGKFGWCESAKGVGWIFLRDCVAGTGILQWSLQWIRDQLQGGDFKAAWEVYRCISVEQPQWVLPKADHRSLIAGLLQARLTAEAIPLMGLYLTR